MALDLSDMDWSKDLLALAGLDGDFFPDWRFPGEPVGEVSSIAAGESGIPEGTPVLAGGHDTQFALIGSGAGRNEAILSSGTWEILAQRSEAFRPSREAFNGGLIFESDAVRGLYDPQILMMGSGVLEWVQSTFFPDIRRGDYEKMIELGQGVPAGSRGVKVLPSFVSDSGPSRRYGTKGTILGLQLGTKREELYRAAIEGLSYQLRNAMEVLSNSTGSRPEGIRVVGGGSKNVLWNQIRADVTELPVTVTSHKEATVIGAAFVAFTGTGRFTSVESGMDEMEVSTKVYEPGPESAEYQTKYSNYMELPAALEPAYSQRD
jgi:L-fuculokinase